MLQIRDISGLGWLPRQAERHYIKFKLTTWEQCDLKLEKAMCDSPSAMIYCKQKIPPS